MSHIRKRKYSVLVRLNDYEQAHLQKLVCDSGLPQETLLRKIILGYQVKASPPIEYFKLIRQLLAIGKNINQIAATANSIKRIEATSYRENYEMLLQTVLALQKIVE